VNRPTLAWLSWAVVIVCGAPAIAGAQQPPPPAAGPVEFSRLWIVGGGASTTMLGDCSDCAADTYLHTGSVLGVIGRSYSPRTDFGAEVLWAPTTLTTGDTIRVTFLMATVQFRPWQTQGFFIRAGSGMAFVRNWLGTIEDNAPSIRSKAFALGLGAGWEWRTRRRLGFQIFGAQHAAALGDLESSEGTAENVMGNFWSAGAAIMIR
jgi:hypothetical protein